MTELLTLEELEQSKLFDKYLNIVEGQPNIDPDNAAFPIKKYQKMELLGKDVEVLNVNVATAIVNQYIADTLTELRITGANAQEVQDWFDATEAMEYAEEFLTDLIATGIAVPMLIRDIEENDNVYRISNVSPVRWFPDLPAQTHQTIKTARVITRFSRLVGMSRVWYMLIERYDGINVTREVYRLAHRYAREGKKMQGMAGLEIEPVVEIGTLPMKHIVKRKSSRSFFSVSFLQQVWELLIEINEIKTQMRQERIKHGKARIALEKRSAMRNRDVSATEADSLNSKVKEAVEIVNNYRADQEVFFIEPGGQIPEYIQRDLQIIEKGAGEIKECLHQIAFIVGMSPSTFGLEEKQDLAAVDKNRQKRYQRNVILLQRKTVGMFRFLLDKRAEMGGEQSNVEIKLASPFEASMKEKIEMYRIANPTDNFLSVDYIVNDLIEDDDERDEVLAQIKATQSFADPVEVDDLDNLNV